MTLNTYQKKCVSMLPKYIYRGDEALMALMALSGVAGDNIVIYKKVLYEGSELPKETLLDNLSEAVYSIAIAAHAFDMDLESVFKRSVEKIDKAIEEKKAKTDAGDKNS